MIEPNALLWALGTRTQPHGWWDEVFTRRIVDSIGVNTRRLVHIRCGAARAAHTLLQWLPETHYFGVENDEKLLASAKQALNGTRFSSRVTLHRGSELSYPVHDGSVDAVLSVLGLQHCEDIPAALAECRRVLAPSGRIVAVEPDNLRQTFYFDGGLDPINECIRTLTEHVRKTKMPADIAIGSVLPRFIQIAGFRNVTVDSFCIDVNRHESAKSFCKRMDRIVDHLQHLAKLKKDAPEVLACRSAIHDLLTRDHPKRIGFSAHLVPTFICRAEAA